eukprot:8775115-Pyramimonas_sp.AAC.1
MAPAGLPLHGRAARVQDGEAAAGRGGDHRIRGRAPGGRGGDAEGGEPAARQRRHRGGPVRLPVLLGNEHSNRPARPASDGSVARIYPRVPRLMGSS